MHGRKALIIHLLALARVYWTQFRETSKKPKNNSRTQKIAKARKRQVSRKSFAKTVAIR